MKLSEQMSYLRGLVDGLDIDMTTKEGKVLGQVLEVLQSTVLYVDDLQDQIDELTELCENLDEDLGNVEEFLLMMRTSLTLTMMILMMRTMISTKRKIFMRQYVLPVKILSYWLIPFWMKVL